MRKPGTSARTKLWLGRARMMISVAALTVIGFVMAGCVKTKPAVDEAQMCTQSVARAQFPPDMNEICRLIRRGDPKSLERVTQFSRCDELTDINWYRLRSICYAWNKEGPVPLVDEIFKGNETFDWTEACEMASGSLNEKLGMAEISGDPQYHEYKRYLSTALDVQLPGDAQDLLCYFAVLDRDNDQVPDYRVSDYGRFVQNDVDVDNDGVRNTRDTNPVGPPEVPPKAESQSCGQGPVPVHAKLGSCEYEEDAACKLQRRLYNEFDVLVVNREFYDDDPRILASLRVIYDAMNLVFRTGIENLEYAKDDCPGKPTLPSFKTVSFEDCPHDTLRIGDGDQQCLEDAYGTQAEAIAQSGTFVVLPEGANSESLIRLGTYVHELGHLVSFALDYDKEKYALLVKHNYWESTNFQKMLSTMGWSIDYKDTNEKPVDAYARRNVLNVEDHVMFDESSYRWNGAEVGELLNMIECGVENPGGCSDEQKVDFVEWNSAYLAYADEFRRNNDAVFTWYGAGDPWEWFSEAVMAYVYRALSAHVESRIEPGSDEGKKTVDKTRVLLRARILESYPGNEFYFENMSDHLMDKFKTLFPMSDQQLDELVCRYIVNSNDVLFGGDWERSPESYDLQGSYIGYFELGETIEPMQVQKDLQELWGPVCTKFKDTLEQAVIQ